MSSNSLIDGALVHVTVTKDTLILNTYTLSNYFSCNNSEAGINGGLLHMFFRQGSGGTA